VWCVVKMGIISGEWLGYDFQRSDEHIVNNNYKEKREEMRQVLERRGSMRLKIRKGARSGRALCCFTWVYCWIGRLGRS
jgi:hypothetical protein